MRRRRLRRRRGQSLVELALITPLLLALVGGGVDLARIYFAGNEVSDAAREAGLYATGHPGYTQANLQSVVDGSTGGNGFACQSPTVQALTSPSAMTELVYSSCSDFRFFQISLTVHWSPLAVISTTAPPTS